MSPLISEVERLRSQIGWGRTLTALWSFGWRLSLATAILWTGFMSTMIVILTNIRDRHTVVFALGVGLALLIGLIHTWCMCRTLERNVPGLIWRVGWKDGILALSSFLWRAIGVVVVFNFVITQLARQSVAVNTLVKRFPTQAVDLVLFLLSVFTVIWGMRATLRIQFRRSLRQRRIQGATGILGDPGGADNR